MNLPDHITSAIKCGMVPEIRDWRNIPHHKKTAAERTMAFAERYLVVPDGKYAGKPLKLDIFQEAFIYAVFDSPDHIRNAYLSIARRNSKSFLNAVLLLSYVCGPNVRQGATVASAANSREQAGLIYASMGRMVHLSPDLDHQTHCIDSSKRIIGKRWNTQYYAMSSDAKTGYGRSLLVVVLDEAGQIVGPETDYVGMLKTSQGSYENPKFIVISTQAATDADFLSVEMDDAIRNQPKGVVVHLYTTPPVYDLLDEAGWIYSNPGLDTFRSRIDLREQLTKAKRIPATSSTAQNLLLNRRVARDRLWLSAEVWKENSGAVDLDVFRTGIVACGLDLSSRIDLTAAVLAAKDGLGHVHLLPFVFAPSYGLSERANRDRAPYEAWAESGELILVPGKMVSYAWVCEFLALELSNLQIEIDFVCFDRWRINDFKQEAENQGFAQKSEWLPVGQGFKDISPRMEAFENVILGNRLHHGSHPLLNMAVSQAIAVRDPAGNRKLDKSRETSRIDPLIASIMSVYQITEGLGYVSDFDPRAMIG